MAFLLSTCLRYLNICNFPRTSSDFRGFRPGHHAVDPVPRTFVPAGIERRLELISALGVFRKESCFKYIMYYRLLLKRIYQRGTWLFAFTLGSLKGIISGIQIRPPDGTCCPSFSKPTFIATPYGGPDSRPGHKMYIRTSTADHCLRTYRLLLLGPMSKFNLPTGVIV